MWQDLRYGLRSIRNQPAFTALAVLTLALGIGAATTIFSVIQNVLLDPFPYKDADRVVAIRIHDVTNPQPFGRGGLQTAEFLDYVEQNQVFEDVIGGTFEDVLMTTTEGTEQLTGGAVTPQHVPVPRRVGDARTGAQVRPTPRPARRRSFVMAHKMWVKHFNADPNVVGRVLDAERRADDGGGRDAGALHEAGGGSVAAGGAQSRRSAASRSGTSVSRRG